MTLLTSLIPKPIFAIPAIKQTQSHSLKQLHLISLESKVSLEDKKSSVSVSVSLNDDDDDEKGQPDGCNQDNGVIGLPLLLP